ncbi:hypothetical protein MLC52_07180 [Sulfurimonas sp. NW15]|uniref:hypothetical protein n=1 Tax=Sulfurimonas sp. NW15 TaxID=2922729 RepID=UPI003DA9E98A
MELINNDIGEKLLEINRQKTLWDEYTYDIDMVVKDHNVRLTMKSSMSPVKCEIPAKDNVRYTYIQNLEDYNLSNSLVLDMIIRNKEFQNYIYYVRTIDFEFEHKSSVLKEERYKQLKQGLIEKFGFNIEDEQKLLFHPYVSESIVDSNEKILHDFLILNPPFINDLKNGLIKVMNFYLQKKQLYRFIQPTHYELINSDNIEDYSDKNLFVYIIHPESMKADFMRYDVYKDRGTHLTKINDSLYTIPPVKEVVLTEISDELIDKHLHEICIPISTDGEEKLVSLGEKNFPIDFLDKDFISSISDDDYINSSHQDSLQLVNLPSIKLKSNKSINVSLNVDLPREELIAYIDKLKGSKDIKSFIEVFDEKIEEIENPKQIKVIAKKRELRNRDYANAFYIYDLYKIIGKEFHKKELELKEEAEAQKVRISENIQYGKEQKKHEFAKIEERLQNHLKLFNKTVLDDEICKLTKIEISKVRALYALLKGYIDEYKFKNVILGK